MDYYEVLRIHPSASEEEIKEAYRRQAHKHHPDVGGDAERFKMIHEAYEILSDTNKRKDYDTGLDRSQKEISFQDEAQRALYKFSNGNVIEAEEILEKLAFTNNDPNAWTYLGTVKSAGLTSGGTTVRQVFDCFQRAAEIAPTQKEMFQNDYCALSIDQINILCGRYLELKRQASKLNRRGFGALAMGGLAVVLGNQSRKSSVKAIGDAGATYGGYRAYENFTQKNSIKKALPFFLDTANELIKTVEMYCKGNHVLYEQFMLAIEKIRTIDPSFRDLGKIII